MANRIIKHLSKGYRQRVGLAQALVNNPPVLILDEPTVGLDPKQIIEIRTLMKKLGKRHTMILSSHILTEIQAVCDRVVIINKGKVAANDTTENLSKSISSSHRITVRLDGKKEDVLQALRQLPGVVSVQADVERETGIWEYNIEMQPGCDIRADLNQMAKEQGWSIYKLDLDELTLEDIFLKITMGEETIPEKEPKKSSDQPAKQPSDQTAKQPDASKKEPAAEAPQANVEKGGTD